MVACSNVTKIDCRLKDAMLARSIREVAKLPQDSPIRKRLKKRGLPCNMNGVVQWLMDAERCEMLITEINGGY